MRYSLINRVKGTFLGALIGQNLVLNHKSSLWQTQVILGAESLTELGRFDLNDWIKRQEKAGILTQMTVCTLPEIVLATLPVTLFFHENNIKLRRNLLNVVEIWQDDPLIKDWTLAVGYAIAQSLTEKLTPVTLIPQIIAFLGETKTRVPQILLKLDNLLTKGAGLEKIQVEFSRETKPNSLMAIGFYCFLSSLEDIRIAVLRATQVKLDSAWIGAVTGALSGAYNGTTNIPASWRCLLVKSPSAQCQITHLSQMLKLSDGIVATWSGVYNPSLHQSELTQDEWAIASNTVPLQAVAAPRIIRLR